jgi:tetratricopeptide (TPR) repeat protein
MKSEERHELKSNELEKLSARLQPIVEKYGLHIVLAVSAAIVIAAAAMFWNRTNTAEKTAGWTELRSANSAETLLAVAEIESLSKKPVAAWARLQAAERYLQTGIRQSLENREGERGLVSDLDEARKNFQLVLDAATANSNLQERALYGLGRCLETMAGVNQRTDAPNSTTVDLLDGAAKAYEKLLSEYPNSAYNQKRYEEEELGNLERHLQYLKSDEASNFYAWFRTQNPKPAGRRGPFDSMPFDHPPFDPGPVTLPPIPEGLRLLDDDTDTDTGPAFPGTSQEPPAGESNGTTPAPKPSAPITPAETNDEDSGEKPDAPSSQPDKQDGQ